MKIKLFLNDVLVNTLAFALLISSQQLVALPIISRKINDPSEFGIILLLFGVINICSVMFGGSIGNVRLITREEYSEFPINGDFKWILIRTLILESILLLFLSLAIFHLSAETTILFTFITTLSTVRVYLVTEYRERLKFIYILTQNVFYLFGILLGLGIFSVFDISWTIVLLSGEAVGIGYSIRNTVLLQEPLKNTTHLLRDTQIKCIRLGFNSGISSSLSYLDRFSIYPLLGSYNVSVYYASSFLSKMGSLILNPITGVLLAWISRIKKDNLPKIYSKIIFFSFIIMIAYFLGSVAISPVLIWYLYPQFYQAAMEIYLYTSLAAAIYSGVMLLRPVLIRFCSITLLNYAYGVYGFLFVTIGVFFAKQNGLLGFSLASIFVNTLFLIMLHSVLFYTIKNGRLSEHSPSHG
ncbi:conserved membrane hypothetical protein [Gammaproteobacteria bacterium]